MARKPTKAADAQADIPAVDASEDNDAPVSEVVRPLTPRQARFVTEYLVDLNGRQAAIRAGYSENAATEQAHRLLRYAHVRAAIDYGREKMVERTQITRDWIAAEAQATYQHARTLGKPEAASGALTLLARLHGHIDDKRTVRLIKRVEDLSDEELAALADIGTDAERDGTRH